MDKLAAPNSMRDAFKILNRMRDDGVIVKYAVGGAVAASIHLEPMTTADMDIFVMLRPPPGKLLVTLDPIYDYLLKHGAAKDGQYIVYAGWPLQFLPADTTPLAAEALDKAMELEADGLSVWVFGAEHLAAIALEVGRPKDKARLHSLVSSGILNKREFKDILRRHNLAKKYEDWQKWQRTR